MTFSKVVSGMGGAPSGLLKSGTNIASKSGKDWVSYGGRRADLDPALTFWAQLNRDTRDVLGAADTFTRASDGLYLPYNGADWRIAGTNAPRHEDGKLLMEPAITNKCTNYNANPDAALSNISTFGVAEGVLSRADDSQALNAAGLSSVCSSGFAFDVDNSGGSGNFGVIVGGTAGNTDVHLVSAFARQLAGGTPAFIRLGASGPSQNITSASYSRVVTASAASSEGDSFYLVCPAGAVARFVLNQLEELPVVTSPIVTLDAAGQRAVDLLSWAGASGFFNQAQGMALTTLKPGYSKTEQAAALQGILSLDSASSSNLLFMDGSIKSTDGTNTAAVVAPAFSANDELKMAVVYGPTGASALQVGYSLNGTAWVWSTAVAYDGGFTLVSALILARAITLPGRYSNVYLYNENRGVAWVESNY